MSKKRKQKFTENNTSPVVEIQPGLPIESDASNSSESSVSVSSFPDADGLIRVVFVKDFTGNFNNVRFNYKKNDVAEFNEKHFEYLNLFKAVTCITE